MANVQKCFLSGGTYPVPGGDEIVDELNALKWAGGYDLVIATQAYRALNHKSHASQHPDKKLFDEVEIHGLTQLLVPDHAIQGRRGLPSHRSDADKEARKDTSAEFHDDLDMSHVIVFQHGTDRDVHSWSAFYDAGRNAPLEVKAKYPFLGRSTGVVEFIRGQAQVKGTEEVHVDIGGLSLDYFVRHTAEDAHDLGFAVRVIKDACRSIASGESTYDALRAYGCKVIRSSTAFRNGCRIRGSRPA
jgi:nicotinamidase/pyrazinamidase